MGTFAERLKIAIERLGISQAEAARLCGITQQSINYIISNDLKSSKLGPKIATALEINPEWLIFGQGKIVEKKFFEVPILQSTYLLKRFINKQMDINELEYILSDIYLGSEAFAFLIESKKLIICSSMYETPSQKYLTVQDLNASITDTKGEVSYPIFEWRIRNVEY